uniref:Uncharacterized protein n=1 Tax=Arundo donax TaxID=35708 RepID=A0A0A8Z004_ARUDO
MLKLLPLTSYLTRMYICCSSLTCSTRFRPRFM